MPYNTQGGGCNQAGLACNSYENIYLNLPNEYVDWGREYYAQNELIMPDPGKKLLIARNNAIFLNVTSETFVELRPGFNTVKGASVLIQTGSCQNPVSDFIPKNINTENISTDAKIEFKKSVHENQFSIYPNPLSEVLNIEVELVVNEPLAITIYDIQGKKISTVVDEPLIRKGLHSYTYDSSQLQSGIYFVNIQTLSFTASEKITKL